MPSTRSDNLRLGLFVLAGTALLVVVLYMLGSKRDLFSRTITVYAHFQQVGGLRPGNNVRYAGINVGTVRAIRIVSDTSVLVTMAIRTSDAHHIRTDAIASLGNDGLMGNKLVNIGPGEGGGGPIAEGAELRTSVPLDSDLMLRTLDRTNSNLAFITGELRTFAARLNTPGGLAHLLTDTSLSHDLRGSLTELHEAAVHARRATAEAEDMMRDVRNGKGALGTLVGDPMAERQVRDWLGTMQQLADSLRAVAGGLERFTSAMNAPGSMTHMMTRDTAAANDLRRTLDQLEKSSATLNENLHALRRNWFFRKYFKEQEKSRKTGP